MSVWETYNQLKQIRQQADQKYYQGKTFDEKKQGLSMMYNAAAKFDFIIKWEKTPENKKKAEEQKLTWMKECMDKLKKLEEMENKPQAMQNTCGGGSSGGNNNGQKDDSEKSKFEAQLSEAIVSEKPNVKWEDIAGLHQAKKALQEAVILPIKFPEFFSGARQPWKGILLYGPPGTGKTFMAKACATETSGTFFSCSSADLVSKFVGESEKLIKTLFGMARDKSPAIIFIDEIDSLCSARGEGQNEASTRIKTEFLVQMEGVGHKESQILVLAATNLPWAIDSAMRRRFQKRIYIPLPDYEGRLYLIEKLVEKTEGCKLEKVQYQELAQKTEGYSGSDLSIFVKDAIMQPLRQVQSASFFKPSQTQQGKYIACTQNDQGAIKKTIYEFEKNEVELPPLKMEHFIDSLTKCKPSVSQDSLGEYQKFTNDFGQEG